MSEPEEYEEASEDPYQGGAVNLRDKEDVSFILELLDPSSTLDRIEHYLKGEVLDFKTETWKKKFSARMNEKGINWVMPYLSMHLDPVFKITTFNKEEINALMQEISCTLVNGLTSEAENFGIDPTWANLRQILDCVEHPIFATMQQSLQNLGRRLITETTQRTENVKINESGDQGSSLPGFNIFARKRR